MDTEILTWVINVVHRVIRPTMLDPIPTVDQEEGLREEITGVGLQVQDLQIQGLQEETTEVGLHLLVEGTTITMQTICPVHLHNQEVHQ